MAAFSWLVYIVLLVCSRVQVTSAIDVDVSECGVTKGCFRDPPDCTQHTCNQLLTWKNGSGVVHFELAAKLSPELIPKAWVAVGFSKDNFMDKTPVVACVVNASDNGTIFMEASYNKPNHNNEPLKQPLLGLVNDSLTAELQGGLLICSFSHYHTVNMSSSSEAHLVASLDANNSYRLLLGCGPASGAGVKYIHEKIPIMSEKKVSLVSNSDVVRKGYSVPSLVRAHGTLMMLAWMVSASVGMILAKHFKLNLRDPICGTKDGWFSLHVTLMFLTVTMTIVGVICIFIQVGGLVKGSLTHPVLGLVVTGLTIINPIMAACRPPPKHKRRKIFNAFHSAVGHLAQLLAAIAMYYGVQYSTANLPFWARWLVLGFIALRVLADLALHLISYCFNNGDSWSYAVYSQSFGIETPQADNVSTHGSVFKYVMLAAFGIGSMAICLTLVIHLNITT